MKYFTHKVVRNTGPEGIRVWRATLNAYRVHLSRIKSRLPVRVQLLAWTCFHDCKITRAAFPGPGQVKVMLAGFRRPFMRRGGRKGIHVLSFRGVASTNLSPINIGAYWGYSEVHIRDGKFKLCAILDHGELEFVFKSVRIS